jgi:hypothetical protein
VKIEERSIASQGGIILQMGTNIKLKGQNGEIS